MKNNRPNENELREQEAPLKNTDRAFVRVDKDGHPDFPREKNEANTEGVEKHQIKKDEND